MAHTTLQGCRSGLNSRCPKASRPLGPLDGKAKLMTNAGFAVEQLVPSLSFDKVEPPTNCQHLSLPFQLESERTHVSRNFPSAGPANSCQNQHQGSKSMPVVESP